jgi:hypothetical protein
MSDPSSRSTSVTKTLSAIFLALLLSIAAIAQNASTQAPKLDIPKGMKQYFIGFLAKGPKYTPNMPEEEHKTAAEASSLHSLAG